MLDSSPNAVFDLVVVGAGISGLTLAWQVLQERPDARVLVVEASAHIGGTCRSETDGGFLYDRGPNGFLTSVPSTWQLAHDVGLGEELVEAAPEAKRRYLLLDDGLEALPHGPASIVQTGLLSARGKLRAAREPFTKPGPDVDESVHAFFARRFGTEVADRFAAPMVMGITSGDARETSVRSVFPRLVEAEQRFGSVVRGMMQLAKQKEPGGPSGRLTSLRRGMGSLTERLGELLGERIWCGARVEALEREGVAWRVRGARDGEPFALQARHIVTAVPAPATARLLESLAPEAAREASAVRYAGVRVLALGFEASAVGRALDGFGFLVPRGGRARVLGCVWPSTVFPGRAPEGHVLLRVIAGGTLDPPFVALDDEAALEAALADLRGPMALRGAPVFVRHAHWERAIPQVEVGHEARVARIDAALSGLPGLHVAGNAFRGISVNDCVAHGRVQGRVIATALAG